MAPETAPVQNPDLGWAIEDVRRRLPGYGEKINYYEGDHRLVFATEKFRNAFGDLFREFADNLCDDVVDEPVDRLQILNWSGSRGAEAQKHWATNKGDARSGAVHLNGYREGDGFVLVWTDPEGVGRPYVKDPATMAVQYERETPDRVRVAGQVWREGKRYRATLYYADHIERYATKGTSPDGGLPKAAAFQPLVEAETLVDETTGESAEVVTQDWYEPHNWGKVPVFHFPNGQPSRYGVSVLKDVIPLQDALNKAVSDMLVAMEFHALPMRWGTGVQVEIDPTTGQEIDPFKSGAERFLRIGNKDANLGQFAPADLSQFLEVQDGFRLEIARKGALPPHSVNLRSGGGAVPSGVALLVAEGKLIKRVRDKQRDWGDTWREVMAMVLTMNGTDCLPEDLEIEWAPPETRDERALIETLLMKLDLGVSKKQALLEAGYTEDEAEEFLEEAEEAAAQMQAQMGAMAGGRLSAVGAGDAAGLQDSLGTPQAPQTPPGAPESAFGR